MSRNLVAEPHFPGTADLLAWREFGRQTSTADKVSASAADIRAAHRLPS